MARHSATNADRPWHVITLADAMTFTTTWFAGALILNHFFPMN